LHYYISLHLARLTHDVEHADDLDGYFLMGGGVCGFHDTRENASARYTFHLVAAFNELAYGWLIVAFDIDLAATAVDTPRIVI
jgi:hypothetical protein